ncbi:hypothetical protein GJ496_002323 [Pomphorhynchus laevis]|nr:hypothetical protein GJ496_002323 [Pomphorhynchus laevis]
MNGKRRRLHELYITNTQYITDIYFNEKHLRKADMEKTSNNMKLADISTEVRQLIVLNDKWNMLLRKIENEVNASIGKTKATTGNSDIQKNKHSCTSLSTKVTAIETCEHFEIVL